MKIQTESIIYPLPDDTLLERIEGNLEVKFLQNFVCLLRKIMERFPSQSILHIKTIGM